METETLTNYTAEIATGMSPIYPNSLMNIKTDGDPDSSLGALWSSSFLETPLGWQFSVGLPYRESYIGILSDEEARGIEEKISIFRKRFEDDLARRNKILFGE